MTGSPSWDGGGRGDGGSRGDGTRQPDDYLLCRRGSNPEASSALKHRQRTRGRLDRLVGWRMRMPGHVQVEKVRRDS